MVDAYRSSIEDPNLGRSNVEAQTHPPKQIRARDLDVDLQQGASELLFAFRLAYAAWRSSL
jgi:hypothetical protein